MTPSIATSCPSGTPAASTTSAWNAKPAPTAGSFASSSPNAAWSASIKYEGMKSITVSEILDRFKERTRRPRRRIAVRSQQGPTRRHRAQGIPGRARPPVRHREPGNPPDPALLLEVTSRSRKAPRSKSADINIEGNKVFSDRAVVRAMKNLRPIGIPQVDLPREPLRQNLRLHQARRRQGRASATSTRRTATSPPVPPSEQAARSRDTGGGGIPHPADQAQQARQARRHHHHRRRGPPVQAQQHQLRRREAVPHAGNARCARCSAWPKAMSSPPRSSARDSRTCASSTASSATSTIVPEPDFEPHAQFRQDRSHPQRRRRQAVLRPPHRFLRQHHHARQGHPPRTADRRRRHVQHAPVGIAASCA